MVIAGESSGKPAFRALRVGAVRPRGWLRDQLRAQAQGLTGHLTTFWDEDSWWRGGAGENMLGEVPARGHATPDLLNGLVPLAWQLDDAELEAEALEFIEHAFATVCEDGRFGPSQAEEEPYRSVVDLGRSKMMEALISYHDVTGDERVVTLIHSYFKGYLASYGSGPSGWFCNTAHQENMVAGLWLYEQTRDESLRSVLIEMCHLPQPEAQWAESSREGRVAVTQGYAIAHALKYAALQYLLEGDRDNIDGVYRVIAMLDEEYGQVGGRYAAHEFLPAAPGRRPTHGTELCDVVEYMYSLEKLFEIVGDPAFGDRLEELAFNSLPGTCTGDFWAHQYDQQANQVLVTNAQREFDNGPEANLYGLMPNYICCTANMHHGWPRYVQHMWMATHDGGVVAFAYGPSEVVFRTIHGVDVVLREETEYPFGGTITFTVDAPQPATFPILFRTPKWISRAGERVVFKYKGRVDEVTGGRLHRIEETWESGEKITLDIPLGVVPEVRSETTVAIRRGPLYFALRIDADYREVAHHYKGSRDWEIRPTSDWNIMPLVHPHHPYLPADVVRTPLTRLPFAGRGEPIYDAEEDAAVPWPHTEPVVLKLKGRRTKNWGVHPVWPSAGDPPTKPEIEAEDIDIELVPYGATRLRVAEFPRADRV
jgi:hypothetical protein